MISNQQLLTRLGLHCQTVEDEARFAQRFLLRTVSETQLFLLFAAIFTYAFFVWDRIIDPVHWEISHLIRGLGIAPALLAMAGLLYTDFGKKHFESVVLTALMVTEVGLAAVYAVLDEGYKYASLAFVLAMLGTTAMFPIRSRYLILASFFTLAIMVSGHLLANNAPSEWLVVNIMAVLSAISFGTVSAYIRERGARFSYRTEKELTASRERVDDLLHSMLPREIVRRIQSGEQAIADSYGEVSIIFADLVGFTELSRKISPAHLVKVLNDLFSTFDLAAEKYGIERIKTIGDAYMAVGGLGRSSDGTDHAINAAELAFTMQMEVRRVVEELGYPIDIRIGLHVGPVVAGVIGIRRPAFDCWGESVNLASRLEAKATPGSILISESAFWRLKPYYSIGEPTEIELKGIGPTPVYVLERLPREEEDATVRAVAAE